jgi:hypothetical protein
MSNHDHVLRLHSSNGWDGRRNADRMVRLRTRPALLAGQASRRPPRLTRIARLAGESAATERDQDDGAGRRTRSWRISGLRVPRLLRPAFLIPRVSGRSTAGCHTTIANVAEHSCAAHTGLRLVRRLCGRALRCSLGGKSDHQRDARFPRKPRLAGERRGTRPCPRGRAGERSLGSPNQGTMVKLSVRGGV